MNRLRVLLLVCLTGPALAADPAPPPATPKATAAAAATDKSAAAATPAPQAATARAPSLAANIHALRIAVEQQDANEAAAQRMTPPVGAVSGASDPTSTETLRSQLATSMSSLDNRCLGVNARANNGSVILICGDNSGEIANTQTRSSTLIPILVQPTPAAAASVPAQNATTQVSP